MEATTGATPGMDERDTSTEVTAPSALAVDELKRDLVATLAARRELGPEYDTQLAEAFVEKVTAQLSARLDEIQRQVKRATPRGAPPHDQRLALAIVSMVMLIPLVAIVLGAGAGLTGLMLLLLAVIAINLGFRYL